MDLRQIASEAASRYGIPEELFFSLIQQESSWKPDVVSSAGAIGPAQLMPGTAKQLGVDPYDPKQNIFGGARYLRQQYDTFGQWPLALAAYNAGPGAVQKYGGIPPYKETQAYVPKVLGRTSMGTGGMPAPSQPRIPTQGAAPMDAQQAPQQPRGLLGLFGPREDDPRSPAERRRDILSNLAIGLSGLSMFPNTAMINALQGGIQERRETRKEALAAEKALQSKSRTVEWLRSQGREDLAAAVEAGALDGKGAAALALSPRDPDYTAMTGKQLNEQFGTRLPEGELYNVSGKGQITKVGGGGVSVNVGGEIGGEGKLRTKLMEKRGEEFASYARSGANSAAALADLNILQQLAPLAPTGPLQGRFAQMFPEANNVSAVWNAIVNRVAPTLRVEGSGDTSDLEFNAMLSSLGSFLNTPEANAAIIAVMQAKAQYNIDRAAIIRDYENEAITLTEANRRLAALEAQSPIRAEVRRILAAYDRGETTSMSREEAQKVLDEM